MKRLVIVPATIVLLVLICVVLGTGFGHEVHAQELTSENISIEDIFVTREFRSDRFASAKWLKKGASYTTIESAEDGQVGRDIIRYSASTGNRNVLVAASSLIPDGAGQPLRIENYSWSEDEKQLLVFTNSKRVWRQNTRSDFWVFDTSSGRLH